MDMRARTKNRVMRVLLAALLESDLTIDELEEFLSVRLENSMLMTELRGALVGLLQYFDGKSRGKFTGLEARQTDEDKIYSGLQRKRLSKSEAIQLMYKFSDSFTKQPLDANATLRELVHLFWRDATPAERREFSAALNDTRGKDAYLEGIISRRRGVSS